MKIQDWRTLRVQWNRESQLEGTRIRLQGPQSRSSLPKTWTQNQASRAIGLKVTRARCLNPWIRSIVLESIEVERTIIKDLWLMIKLIQLVPMVNITMKMVSWLMREPSRAPTQEKQARLKAKLEELELWPSITKVKPMMIIGIKTWIKAL